MAYETLWLEFFQDAMRVREVGSYAFSGLNDTIKIQNKKNYLKADPPTPNKNKY